MRNLHLERGRGRGKRDDGQGKREGRVIREGERQREHYSALPASSELVFATGKPRVNDKHGPEPRIRLVDSPAQGWVVVDPQGIHPDPEQCGGWLEERASVRTIPLGAGTHSAQVILATATVAGCSSIQGIISLRTVDYLRLKPSTIL